MGRLENIIARNTKPPSEKVVVTLALGVIILVLLVLAVFTDLGKPPIPANARSTAGSDVAGSGSAVVEPPRDKHLNGVLLRSPHARPATPATSAAAPSAAAPSAAAPSAAAPATPATPATAGMARAAPATSAAAPSASAPATPATSATAAAAPATPATVPATPAAAPATSPTAPR